MHHISQEHKRVNVCGVGCVVVRTFPPPQQHSALQIRLGSPTLSALHLLSISMER